MSKILPAISGPGSMKLRTKGGRNATTEEARSGAGGIAPIPAGGANMLGNDRPSHPTQSGLGRVRGANSSGSGAAGSAGSFNPLQNNAMRNLASRPIGQAETSFPGGSRTAPKTRTAATGNPVATSKPRRRGLGAAFFGEYPGQ